MSENTQDHIDKKGLYTGNVILEILPDAKGIKPIIKVNELASEQDMEIALNNFNYLLTEVHVMLYESKLPITYLLPKEEKPVKTITTKETKEVKNE